MKKLYLFISSFSQNIISSIILIAILSVAFISIQDVVGQYRYITYSKYIIDNQYLKNSDYFMTNPSSTSAEEINGNIDEYTEKIFNNISKFDGIDGIAHSTHGSTSYRDTPANYEIYDEYMEKSFSKQLTEGCWFDDAESSGDKLNCVVAGPLFNDIPIGSDISIALYNQNGETYHTVHIIGKVGYPWYMAEYSTISDNISANDFLMKSNCIIFDDNEQTYKLLDKYSYYTSYLSSYFVMYDENCTNEQKTAIRDYMNSIGMYADYDTIVENTDNNLRDIMINTLITPIFLLIVATVALISISTLNTYKKLKTHSVYYLCGCSRLKSFAYLFGEISLVSVISTIINIIYVSNVISQLTNGTKEYENCIVDYQNIIFAIIYCIVTITITTILPFIVYKKNTPLEIYRRNHND